mmetsp:Transcript_9026/g.33286  ORF Transcript_9026/g.33286 Transcript_9026/m.33286 type:complete len:302 (-) Transcript_9026:2470-3375(-)
MSSVNKYHIDLTNPSTSPLNEANQDLNNNAKNSQTHKIGRQFEDPTEEDNIIISHQLRKESITPPEKVLFRCKYGYPAVTLAGCAKKKQGTIVPGTLLWLTCPRRSNLVSHLEQTKFLKDLENEYIVEKSQDLVTSHENFRAHMRGVLDRERYVKWVSSNSVKDPEVKEEDIPVKRYGNAGVSAAVSVKCMHAHVAGFTAGVDDPVARRGIQETALRHITDIEDIEDVLKTAQEEGDDSLRHLMDCPAKCVLCSSLPRDHKYRRLRKRKRDKNAGNETTQEGHTNTRATKKAAPQTEDTQQ